MDKIKVKKSNRVLMVPAEDKDKYLAQGYEIYSEDGKLIAKPQTDTEVKLNKALAENAEIKEKLEVSESENASLKEQLAGAGADGAKEIEAIKAENAALKEEIASLKEQLAGAGADGGDGKKGEAKKPAKSTKAE